MQQFLFQLVYDYRCYKGMYVLCMYAGCMAKQQWLHRCNLISQHQSVLLESSRSGIDSGVHGLQGACMQVACGIVDTSFISAFSWPFTFIHRPCPGQGVLSTQLRYTSQ